MSELLVAFHQHLLTLRVHDVTGRNTPDQILWTHGNLFDLCGLQLTNHHTRQFFTLFGDQLVGFGIANVLAGFETNEMVGLKGQTHLFSVEGHSIRLIKIVEQIFRGHSEGAQQDGDREFSPAVNPNVQNVPRVEFKIQPRPAVRNDPGGIEELAAGVGLSLIVLEEHARRAMELANDDPFGSVHHEGAVFGHQRDFPEIDLLLLDITDAAIVGLGVHIPEHHLHGDLQGSCIGHAPLMTLFDVILGITQAVAHELQGSRIIEVFDGENRFENPLQPKILTLVRSDVLLQKEFK